MLVGKVELLTIKHLAALLSIDWEVRAVYIISRGEWPWGQRVADNTRAGFTPRCGKRAAHIELSIS
jgi:hypothetical protein